MSAFSALIGSCYYYAVSLSWKISFSGEKHVSRAERFFVSEKTYWHVWKISCFSEKHINRVERLPVSVKTFLQGWKISFINEKYISGIERFLPLSLKNI